MKMADVWSDLKPNREILDSSFEGYRLSIEKQPYYSDGIPGVNTVSLSAQQFSLQHARLFSMHNALVLDQWMDELSYILNNSMISVINSAEDGKPKVSPVFGLTPGPPRDDTFNPSLVFASSCEAVLTDGCGRIFIINTGDRAAGDEWKVEYEVMRESPCIVLAATPPTDGILMYASAHVSERLEDKKFATVITISTLVRGGTGDNNFPWNLTHTKTLETTNLEYITFDEYGYIHIASTQHQFGDKISEPMETEETLASKPLYTWLDDEDDITATLQLSPDVSRTDVDVTMTSSRFTVRLKGNVMLEGELYRPIRPDECTWTINDDYRLEIFLTKRDPDPWNELITGDTRGEKLTDRDQIDAMLQGLQHLTSESMETGDDPPRAVSHQELEECDFTSGEDSLHLVKLSPTDESLRPVSIVNLTGTQWLFNFHSSSPTTKSFCSRHDVDGLVWQPSTSGYKHTNTFNALGYVQASKQRRLYTLASPNCSYAAIADSDRHIYLYRQPSPIQSDLRNRRTGQSVSHVAQQQVLTLETFDPILGMACTNQSVLVLTRDKIHQYKI